MKKTTYLALALTICLLFTGCCFSHDWAEATCTAPKTCTKCEKTEGELLPHTPGEWLITDHPYNGNDGSRERHCIDCDGILDTEIFSLEELHNGTFFTFTDQEFLDRLNGLLKDISPDYSCEFHEKYDGKNLCILMKGNGQTKAAIEDASSKNASPFTKLVFFSNNSENIVLDNDSFIFGQVFLMACDPQLTQKTAESYINELKELKIAGSMTIEEKKHNDLYYWLLFIGGKNGSLQLEVSPQSDYYA